MLYKIKQIKARGQGRAGVGYGMTVMKIQEVRLSPPTVPLDHSPLTLTRPGLWPRTTPPAEMDATWELVLSQRRPGPLLLWT